jgi:hypothetical protein
MQSRSRPAKRPRPTLALRSCSPGGGRDKEIWTFSCGFFAFLDRAELKSGKIFALLGVALLTSALCAVAVAPDQATAQAVDD